MHIQAEARWRSTPTASVVSRATTYGHADKRGDRTEKGAHARAFRGSTKTGPPTTTTLRLDTSSFFTQAPCSLLAAESWLCHPTSAPARYFVAFYAGSSVWAPEPSRVKNRIREERQQFLRFECQKRIDSMLFLPFGLRKLFRNQKLEPRGVPRMLRI